MNGWTNHQTWNWWTHITNHEPHQIMVYRWAREARGDIEKLADVGKTWKIENINWIEIAAHLVNEVSE